MKYRRELFLVSSLAFCLTAILALWSQAEGRGQLQATGRYVGALGLDTGGCTDPAQPCATVQYALDAAEPGDIIKIASGIYSGINSHGNLAQVAYVDKDITLAGGYAVPGFPEPPDPVVNVTTIDAQGLGRGLVITGPITVTVHGLNITRGNATGLGGGPGGADAGAGVLVAGANTLFENNRLMSNSCQACLGGGLAMVDSLATLEGNQIASNSAGMGGGLALVDSLATVQGNQIASNGAGLGGGICIAGGSATLKANAMHDNTAADSGGGLYVSAAEVLVDANAVSGNSADGSGGGIFLEASLASLVNNSISANSLAGNGAGVYVDGGDVVMTGNTISDNTSSWNSGGGVYLWHSAALLNENAITNNAAHREGGGLYLTYSLAQLRDNLIQENSANGQNYPDGGGGLYLNYSDAVVDGNRLLDNEANDGGAVYFWQSNPILSNNIIAGNSAGDGGALWIWLSNPILINNVVAENQAATLGSGIYVLGSGLRMVHNTIASNSGGDGTGIHVTDGLIFPYTSTVYLTDTIIVSHSVGIQVAAGNTVVLEATLWGSDDWANDTDWAGPGTLDPGAISIWGDPAFWHPDRRDYHILEGSAARNAGIDAGLAFDIDGQPRPNEAGHDVGADEYWPFSTVYLPLIMIHPESPSSQGSIP